MPRFMYQKRTKPSCGRIYGTAGKHSLKTTCSRCLRNQQETSLQLHCEGAFLVVPRPFLFQFHFAHRYNRAKLERLRKEKEEKDFEKVYKQSYWSYTKSMLKQCLTVLEGDQDDPLQLEDTALRMFYTIQQHAGIL